MSDLTAAQDANQRRHSHKHAAVTAVIEQMVAVGQVWSYEQIAVRAGCHRTFVSKWHHVDRDAAVTRITAQLQAGIDALTRSTAARYKAENHNLRRLMANEKKLNERLRKRLACVLGDEVLAEMEGSALGSDQRTSEELASLRRQVLELHQQLAERDEELAAATRTNKQILRELNHAKAKT